MEREKTIAVEFSGVNFSHKESDVLRDSSFHVHAGEFVTLVGPNGSGKTTILRLIMGLARPQSGTIKIFGVSPREARGELGYVPQYMLFDQAFPISVHEVVKMGRLESFKRNCARQSAASSCPDIDSALALTDIADLRDRPYAALSGGQRRRVLVARALASAPKLLILDEPTANMDKESEERLFKVLGNLKKTTTILIATHDTTFVSSLTDVVLCIRERDRRGGSIVRHGVAPVGDRIPGLRGADAILRVLHDTELSDSCCGRDEEKGGTL